MYIKGRPRSCSRTAVSSNKARLMWTFSCSIAGGIVRCLRRCTKRQGGQHAYTHTHALRNIRRSSSPALHLALCLVQMRSLASNVDAQRDGCIGDTRCRCEKSKAAMMMMMLWTGKEDTYHVRDTCRLSFPRTAETGTLSVNPFDHSTTVLLLTRTRPTCPLRRPLQLRL